jgi:uncharacterized protein (DUF427 family)
MARCDADHGNQEAGDPILDRMNLMDTVKRAIGADSASPRRMRAVWNGAVIAESDETVMVEGNHYFPAPSVDQRYLRPSSNHTVCAWKGLASYYDVVVGDQVNPDAAWYYPEPKSAAAEIKDRIAFWHGVKVQPAG